MTIKSLYTKRDELKVAIEGMAGKKGLNALRVELEGINTRLAQLDARRRQMKANVNSQNVAGRSKGFVEDTRKRLDELKTAQIIRFSYDELGFCWRDEYGQRSNCYGKMLESTAARYPTHPNARPFAAWNRANATLRAAIDDGVIEHTDADFDKKGRGTATNHDLYSYSADGTLILVQIRHATVTKYGTSVKIQYFVTDGDDSIEIEKGKANIKKAAQADPSPDSPLRFLRNQLKAEWRNKIDENPVKLAAPKVSQYTIYKILHDDNGVLRSVYSGEEYTIGKQKTQKACEEHGGGYYAFLSAEIAIQVAQYGDAFASQRVDGKRLVLCKGRGYGTPVTYSNNKHAFSRLVVDEIVGEVSL